MFLNHIEQQGLLKRDFTSGILASFPLDVRRKIIAEVNQAILDDGKGVKSAVTGTPGENNEYSNVATALKLTSPSHVRWVLEVVGEGMHLPIGDIQIVASSLAVYSSWLFDEERQPKILRKLKGTKFEQEVYCKIAMHLSQVFDIRQSNFFESASYSHPLHHPLVAPYIPQQQSHSVLGNSGNSEAHTPGTTEPNVNIGVNDGLGFPQYAIMSSNKGTTSPVNVDSVDAANGRLLEMQTDLCHAVFRVYSKMIHDLGDRFTEETWLTVMRVILGVTDYLLRRSEQKLTSKGARTGKSKSRLDLTETEPTVSTSAETILEEDEFEDIEEYKRNENTVNQFVKRLNEPRDIEEFDSVSEDILKILANNLCVHAVSLLTDIWLRSQCRIPEIWDTLKLYFRKWLGRVQVIQQWNSTSLGLCNKIINELYGEKEGTKSISIVANNAFIGDLNVPKDVLFYAWKRHYDFIAVPSILTSLKPLNFEVLNMGVARIMKSFHNLNDESNTPDGNTLLHMFGHILFKSASIENPKYDTGRAEAIGCLCRIFGKKQSRTKFNPIYMKRFYAVLDAGLNNLDMHHSVTSLIVNGKDLFLADLPGIRVFALKFIRLIASVLPTPATDFTSKIPYSVLRGHGYQFLSILHSMPFILESNRIPFKGDIKIVHDKVFTKLNGSKVFLDSLLKPDTTKSTPEDYATLTIHKVYSDAYDTLKDVIMNHPEFPTEDDKLKSIEILEYSLGCEKEIARVIFASLFIEQNLDNIESLLSILYCFMADASNRSLTVVNNSEAGNERSKLFTGCPGIIVTCIKLLTERIIAGGIVSLEAIQCMINTLDRSTTFYDVIVKETLYLKKKKETEESSSTDDYNTLNGYNIIKKIILAQCKFLEILLNQDKAFLPMLENVIIESFECLTNWVTKSSNWISLDEQVTKSLISVYTHGTYISTTIPHSYVSTDEKADATSQHFTSDQIGDRPAGPTWYVPQVNMGTYYTYTMGQGERMINRDAIYSSTKTQIVNEDSGIKNTAVSHVLTDDNGVMRPSVTAYGVGRVSLTDAIKPDGFSTADQTDENTDNYDVSSVDPNVSSLPSTSTILSLSEAITKSLMSSACAVSYGTTLGAAAQQQKLNSSREKHSSESGRPSSSSRSRQTTNTFSIRGITQMSTATLAENTMQPPKPDDQDEKVIAEEKTFLKLDSDAIETSQASLGVPVVFGINTSLNYRIDIDGNSEVGGSLLESIHGKGSWSKTSHGTSPALGAISGVPHSIIYSGIPSSKTTSNSVIFEFLPISIMTSNVIKSNALGSPVNENGAFINPTVHTNQSSTASTTTVGSNPGSAPGTGALPRKKMVDSLKPQNFITKLRSHGGGNTNSSSSVAASGPGSAGTPTGGLDSNFTNMTLITIENIGTKKSFTNFNDDCDGSDLEKAFNEINLGAGKAGSSASSTYGGASRKVSSLNLLRQRTISNFNEDDNIEEEVEDENEDDSPSNKMTIGKDSMASVNGISGYSVRVNFGSSLPTQSQPVKDGGRIIANGFPIVSNTIIQPAETRSAAEIKIGSSSELLFNEIISNIGKNSNFSEDPCANISHYPNINEWSVVSYIAESLGKSTSELTAKDYRRYIRVFSLRNNTLLTVIELPPRTLERALGDESIDSDTLTAHLERLQNKLPYPTLCMIVRDSTGVHSWMSSLRYFEDKMSQLKSDKENNKEDENELEKADEDRGIISILKEVIDLNVCDVTYDSDLKDLSSQSEIAPSAEPNHVNPIRSNAIPSLESITASSSQSSYMDTKIINKIFRSNMDKEKNHLNNISKSKFEWIPSKLVTPCPDKSGAWNSKLGRDPKLSLTPGVSTRVFLQNLGLTTLRPPLGSKTASELVITHKELVQLKMDAQLLRGLSSLDDFKPKETFTCTVLSIPKGFHTLDVKEVWQKVMRIQPTNVDDNKITTEFYHLLHSLGWKVDLSSHTGFAGGLLRQEDDFIDDSDIIQERRPEPLAKESIYFADSDIEVMYHVPYLVDSKSILQDGIISEENKPILGDIFSTEFFQQIAIFDKVCLLWVDDIDFDQSDLNLLLDASARAVLVNKAATQPTDSSNEESEKKPVSVVSPIRSQVYIAICKIPSFGGLYKIRLFFNEKIEFKDRSTVGPLKNGSIVSRSILDVVLRETIISACRATDLLASMDLNSVYKKLTIEQKNLLQLSRQGISIGNNGRWLKRAQRKWAIEGLCNKYSKDNRSNNGNINVNVNDSFIGHFKDLLS